MEATELERPLGLGLNDGLGLVPERTYTRTQLLAAIEAERHACSIAVWMTLQDALAEDADDKGLDGWLREAEQRVKNRSVNDPDVRALWAAVDLHNPWRTSLENCISGDNYLRAREYRDLIEELDDLYRLRAVFGPNVLVTWTQQQGRNMNDHTATEQPPAAPAVGAQVDLGVRPQPGAMKPFEWMAWEARDFGADKLAEACNWLVGSRNQAMQDADWQASRRMEVQAKCDRLSRFLETIRDTGMTAEDAAEHAAEALRPNV